MKRKTVMQCILVGLCFGILVSSVEAREEKSDNKDVGEVAYSGRLAPSDIFVEEIARLQEADEDVKIDFAVSIPAVRDGKVVVNDVSGLPIAPPMAGAEVSSAIVEIPFSATDYREAGAIDTTALSAHVDDVLEGLISNEQYSTQNALNDPNCGGYPLGTLVTVVADSCVFGKFTTIYKCMINPVTFGNDWYITSQTWQPPTCMVP